MVRMILVGTLVLAIGCGREFAPDNEFSPERLKPGTSTNADVLAMTGEPYTRELLPDGIEMWTYLWLPGKRPVTEGPFLTSPMPTTVVTLQFRDGVLVDPDPAVFRTFTPGTTTADEVRAAAGEPVMRNALPDGTEAWTYVFGSTRTTSSVRLLFQEGVLVRTGVPAK